MKKLIISYGYEKSDFQLIFDVMKENFKDIELISKTGKKELTINKLLEDYEKGNFKNILIDNTERFIMFLGFNQDEIQKALNIFPFTGNKRPMFCGLTQHNIEWKQGYLLNHLIEEKTELSKKMADYKNKKQD